MRAAAPANVVVLFATIIRSPTSSGGRSPMQGEAPGHAGAAGLLVGNGDSGLAMLAYAVSRRRRLNVIVPAESTSNVVE